MVAEAIAGDEGDFARLMTRKALALGMSRTVYRNASGLPDDDQVTTARDQATLGRAIQERFPKYYKYFSIRSFTFRGQSIGNHNHLLGRVDGVDGIKTGYINASGFNLVTSVHRGNRYLVAVVMGGGSAGSRDAKMRELINDKIAQASTKRTAPMVAEGGPSETASEPKAAAKVETKPEAKQEPKFTVASAASSPARFTPGSPRSEPSATATIAQSRVSAGSTDPIRPVPVKTLTVKSGAPTPAPAPLQVAPPQPAAEPAPTAAPAPTPAPVQTAPVQAAPVPPPPAPAVAAKPELAAKPEVAAKPGVVAKPEITAKPEQRLALASATTAPARFIPTTPPAEPASTPRAEQAAALPPPPPGAAPGVLGLLPVRSAALEPPAPALAAAPPPAKPVIRSGWMIQVGAYPAEEEAKQRLSAVQSKASKILNGADPFTETVDKGGTTYYRARFAGLDKDKAEAACKYLKRTTSSASRSRTDADKSAFRRKPARRVPVAVNAR